LLLLERREGRRFLKEASLLLNSLFESILYQLSTHTDSVLCFIADILIESHNRCVVCSYLQVNFRAAHYQYLLLGDCRNLPPQTSSLVVGSDSQVMYPSPVSVITTHNRCYNPTTNQTNQKKFGIHLEFTFDIQF
jgi:hypothetical protein